MCAKFFGVLADPFVISNEVDTIFIAKLHVRTITPVKTANCRSLQVDKIPIGISHHPLPKSITSRIGIATVEHSDQESLRITRLPIHTAEKTRRPQVLCKVAFSPEGRDGRPRYSQPTRRIR